MKHNYNSKEVQRYLQSIILTAEDGTEYKGDFIDLRIDKATIPEGKYMYHCRHDDNGDWCEPVTIEPLVVVNFCGTFVTDKEIEWPNVNDKYIPIDHSNLWIY